MLLTGCDASGLFKCPAPSAPNPPLEGEGLCRLRNLAQRLSSACEARADPRAQVGDFFHADLMRHLVGVPFDVIVALQKIVAAHRTERGELAAVEIARGPGRSASPRLAGSWPRRRSFRAILLGPDRPTVPRCRRAAMRNARRRRARSRHPARNRRAGCSTRRRRDSLRFESSSPSWPIEEDANPGFHRPGRCAISPSRRCRTKAHPDMPPLIVISRTALRACGTKLRQLQGRPCAVDELRHDRLEVMAIGAQAMQPDHGVARVRGGFEFDRLVRHWVVRGYCLR